MAFCQTKFYATLPESGLPAVLLRSSEASIRLDLEEAQRIVHARRPEAHRTNELKAMPEYAYEKIIAINREGKVTGISAHPRTI
jgi:hypothetical protein